MQHYCRNCGRHGENLKSCPRCSEAHARFLMQNFTHEWACEREFDQRRRDALRYERERVEEMRHQQFLTEQQWRTRAEAEARARQMKLQHQHAPGRLQRPRPDNTLSAAADLVSDLRVLPDVARDTVVGAMREALHPR